MPLVYVLGFPAVLVCIVATASMAFRFGWQFGTEPWEQWSFALGLAAMDVIKAFLLLSVAGAWRARQYGRVGVALAAFVVFTSLSLLSSFGMAAIQSALKVGSHTATANVYKDRKAEVDRLVAQREALQNRSRGRRQMPSRQHRRRLTRSPSRPAPRVTAAAARSGARISRPRSARRARRC